MDFNFVALLGAAVVTLLINFIWYSPKVFGTLWIKEAGLSTAVLQKRSLLKIWGFTFIFSFMMTIIVMGLTIHQSGAVGMIGGVTMIESAKPSFASFMADYGMAFRTFKHGALHGFITGLFFAFPIVGITSLMERKSWKYIFIHAGYWIVTLTLMGGIICAFA